MPWNVGIGHLPVQVGALAAMELTWIGNRPVDESELEGYRSWREDSAGGVFA